jgi:hypothetical protein
MSNDNGCTTTLGDFIRQVVKGEENGIEVVQQVATGPDGAPIKHTVLALQNRKLQPEPPEAPQRAESPRRAHVFHDAAGLAAYLKQYRTGHTTLLADITSLSIRVVLDESAAQGVETLLLIPQIHPLFKPWKSLLEISERQPVPLAQFAAFIMQNRRAVKEPDGKDLALTFSQVRAATSVTLQQGAGRKAVNGLMVTTEIQSTRMSEPVNLPDAITITTPLFVGGHEHSLEVDILVSAVDGGAKLVVQASSAQIAEAMLGDFQGMVRDLAAVEGITCGLGQIGHEDWDYIE